MNNHTNITKVKGDLIEMADSGDVDAIAHGCNCFHVMGGGIAKSINKWSKGKALATDKQTLYGDINKLGTYSSFEYKGIECYNLYTQFVTMDMIPHRTGNEVMVHWLGVYESIIAMLDVTSADVIGIPYIGCGLAGGKEEHLMVVLKDIARWGYDVEIKVVEYEH